MTQITGSFDVAPEGKGEGIPMAFHFQRQLDDMRISNQDRFEAAERAIAAAFETAQEALSTAFTAHDRVHLEQGRLEDERFDTSRGYRESAWTGHAEIHRLQDQAIVKSEASINERLHSVNEFRAQLNDQTLTLMPRTEATGSITAIQATHATAFTTLNEKINDLTNRINLSQGRDDGTSRAKTQQSTIIGLVIALVGVVLTAIIFVAGVR
ncbi:MAG: hypothetical protein M3Q75_06730 [Gemmatimonadota bacterium]|nr:hypothetical protein [Gemmatimonadota bacterium]